MGYTCPFTCDVTYDDNSTLELHAKEISNGIIYEISLAWQRVGCD